VGTTNSANLLDGVDGLLGGCAMIDFATFALICVSLASADGSTNLLNTAIFLRRHGRIAPVYLEVQLLSRGRYHAT
jgi:UDP-N-acetylmuramyl pentapeptide phosphotransferase/UDP-N-acetylglucosamine-1-phosphate transferase